MKIVVNGGHCPRLDDGGKGVFSTEAQVTEELMHLVSGYLRRVGYLVLEIQENELTDIVEKCNAFEPEFVISIHCGMSEDPSVCGTRVFYDDRAGEMAAHCLLEQVTKHLETVNMGVRQRPELYIFKHVHATAVWIEAAYITNEEDEKNLLVHRDGFARAIARGITDYHVKVQKNAVKNREFL